jgi:thiamine biosynthesis lipoprotein
MKKLFLMSLVCLVAACGGIGKRKASIVATIDGFALGTYYHVVTISADTLHGIDRSIDSLLLEIDNSMSIFNPNSLVSRLNRNETDSLDRYITQCINTATSVSELSGGLYDITVKPLTQAWGFATEEQFREPNLDSLLQFVGYRKLSVADGRLVKEDPRVQLDLNSIAKGYTADMVAELIASRGVERYMVEIGGEVVARGNNPGGKPWTVGIEKPAEGNMIPGSQTEVVFSLENRGVATSGNYRNYRYDNQGRKLVHSINPLTGSSSPSNILSTTVVAKTCAYADAISTALMLSEFTNAIKMISADPELWAYIIYADDNGQIKTWASAELEARFLEPMKE